MELALFLQEGPAQTTDYMIAGYVVILGVMAVYMLSLWLRKRNLLRRWKMLSELRETQKEKPSQA
ncbi:MAG: hypothetical protein ACPL3P_03100 [Anaerolineales bacterium]